MSAIPDATARLAIAVHRRGAEPGKRAMSAAKSKVRGEGVEYGTELLKGTDRIRKPILQCARSICIRVHIDEGSVADSASAGRKSDLQEGNFR